MYTLCAMQTKWISIVNGTAPAAVGIGIRYQNIVFLISISCDVCNGRSKATMMASRYPFCHSECGTIFTSLVTPDKGCLVKSFLQAVVVEASTICFSGTYQPLWSRACKVISFETINPIVCNTAWMIILATKLIRTRLRIWAFNTPGPPSDGTTSRRPCSARLIIGFWGHS